MTKTPDLNVELKEIPNLSFVELKDLYITLYNQEPPKATTRKEFFIWRVTHRLQELRFGGLDAKTKSLLENMDKSLIPEKTLSIGTEIVRKFKGETYRLRIVNGGFEMDNEFYKSLSAVAYKNILSCVCDKQYDRAQDTATKYRDATGESPIIIQDINKFLLHDLDLITIATDSGSHFEIAKKCLLSHKNVLIEKPLSLSTFEAIELDKLAQLCNCFLGVCYQKRYNKPVHYLLKAINDNRFGRIFSIDVQTLWNRNNDYYKADEWRGTWMDDGGVLMNQSIHSIDIAQRCINNEPEEIFAMIKNFNHPIIEVEDYGALLVKFKNGAILTMKGTVNCFKENYKETLLVIGEKGIVEIGRCALDKMITWKFQDVKKYDDVWNIAHSSNQIYGDGHKYIYKDAYNCIKYGKIFEINAKEALKSLNIVLAAYKSAITNQPVAMHDFSFSLRDVALYLDNLQIK